MILDRRRARELEGEPSGVGDRRPVSDLEKRHHAQANQVPPDPPGRDRSGAEVLERTEFAGRGPRNWRRADRRVREDVCEALTVHPEVDATDLEVTVEDGVVTLAGTVEDRRTKRLAVDVAESVAGVRDVLTRIRVRNR